MTGVVTIIWPPVAESEDAGPWINNPNFNGEISGDDNQNIASILSSKYGSGDPLNFPNINITKLFMLACAAVLIVFSVKRTLPK